MIVSKANHKVQCSNLKVQSKEMKYYSTNKKAPIADLHKAVVKGLAEDRGLYMPEIIKKLPQDFFDNIEKLSFQEIAYQVADAFFGEDVDADSLKKIVYDTLAFDCPVVEVEPNIYSLELFHGPTLAFKDVGARFMARLLQYFVRQEGKEEVNVLVATSGDTGSAVANGFLGVEGIHVYVLYPKGKVSITSSSGFKASDSYTTVTYTQTAGTSLPTGNTGSVLTAPATPSTSNFGVYTGSASAGTITFQASDPNRTANGYELEVRNLKGKLIKTISCSSTYSASTKFGKNTPYKYRIRLYATNGVTKMYSGWSGYRYFWLSNVTGKKHYSLRSSNAKIKLHWAKVSGTKGYNVLMSTSRDGKYKKVKSLSKKAKSVTLTKFGKKKLNKYKTYYIKVVAKIKVGKKTVSNDAQLINYNY